MILAEQFLRFNASYAKSDRNWLNTFPNSKPTSSEVELEWNEDSLFELGSTIVYSDSQFDPTSNTNIGIFLLEHATQSIVDFGTIMRVWKNITVTENGGEEITLFLEASWPAELPYDKRDKSILSLDLFTSPEIALDNALYNAQNCTIEKMNGGGYTTTLLSVLDNGDTTYTIDLLVEHDGCNDADCPPVSQLSVEAESGTYAAVSIDGIGGSLNLGPHIPNEPFSGFSLNSASGMGNGVTGAATIAYTVSILQDQKVSVLGDSQSFVAEFHIDDFEYMLNCQSPITETPNPCGDENLLPPEWPNPDFTWVPTSGSVNVDNYFCQYLGNLYEPVDPEGIPLENLVVTVTEGPTWLYWSPDYSQIAGTPEETGTFTWTLEVSDGCFSSSTTMTITVSP